MSTTHLEESSAQQQRVSSVKTLLHLLRAAFVSVCGGCLVGLSSLFLLPCHWLGSSSEGGCGYGVLWTAIGAGVVVASLLFLWLGVRTLRTLYASALAQAAQRPDSALLARAWLILLLIHWAILLLGAVWPSANAGFKVNVMWLSFLAFAVASVLMLRRMQLPTWLGLLLLMPLLGLVLLPCAIFREVLSLATAQGTETVT